MTIEERIKALEQELIDLKAELEKPKDVMAEYHNFKEEGDAYFITECNIGMDEVENEEYYNNTNQFAYYHDREYAAQALELKAFNDKLLAFKWCYDRDYKPDWSDESNTKYRVKFDSTLNKYMTYVNQFVDENTVYFSTEEIAQKCCDWLNQMEVSK